MFSVREPSDTVYRPSVAVMRKLTTLQAEDLRRER